MSSPSTVLQVDRRCASHWSSSAQRPILLWRDDWIIASRLRALSSTVRIPFCARRSLNCFAVTQKLGVVFVHTIVSSYPAALSTLHKSISYLKLYLYQICSITCQCNKLGMLTRNRVLSSERNLWRCSRCYRLCSGVTVGNFCYNIHAYAYRLRGAYGTGRE